MDSNTTSVQDQVRMLLVYDTQPNGALPGITTVLKDANAAAATTVNSHLNLDDRERFQIVRDMLFMMPAATYAAGVITNSFFPDPIKQSFNVNEFR